MKFPNLDAEIAAYLRREGITQAELAERMGMARLADLMGKSIDYLTGRVSAST